MDPYAAPKAETLDRSVAARSAGWRGAAWFLLPLVLLVALVVVFDTDPASDTDVLATFLLALSALTLPAAGVGYASGHLVHRTGWPRYLVMVAIAAACWALVSTVAFIAIVLSVAGADVPWRARMLLVPARMSIVTIPVSLILASTFRLFHRRA
jgi:hypothetical protein